MAVWNSSVQAGMPAPVMGRDEVTISGAHQRAARSWWLGEDHAGGGGGVEALEPMVPEHPPGSSLAHSSTRQDSCQDQRVRGLTSVEEKRGASARSVSDLWGALVSAGTLPALLATFFFFSPGN